MKWYGKFDKHRGLVNGVLLQTNEIFCTKCFRETVLVMLGNLSFFVFCLNTFCIFFCSLCLFLQFYLMYTKHKTKQFSLSPFGSILSLVSVKNI